MAKVSRGAGQSAIAKAAYNARDRMKDDRVGRSFNYRSRTDLLSHEVVNWDGTAAELWNAAEAAEKRKNSVTARSLHIALPAELPLQQQKQLVRGFALWLRDEFGVASQTNIHAPHFHRKTDERQFTKKNHSSAEQDNYMRALKDPKLTNRNFHVHILFTTRKVERGTFGAKTRELDDRKTGPAALLRMRAEWEKRANSAMKCVGAKQNICLAKKGAELAQPELAELLSPEPHLGPRLTAVLRKKTAAKATTHRSKKLVALKQARAFNRHVMKAWQHLRDLQRERDREQQSARIAVERETARRRQAELEKERIRTARTAQEVAEALKNSSSIHAVRSDDSLTQAMAAARSECTWSAAVNDDEELIDLEAKGLSVSTPENRTYRSRKPRAHQRGR
ncbi:MobA/MobL family protein [Pseudaestuariivita rosea]|uniref:MobA/MobL family protein n=1 Tax=Pseudaestuariivita rosea TaxID=2763263 RepID=UPI001ABBC827|nr:MobA/MobL family protein [Pseudaestuariivita rosea]